MRNIFFILCSLFLVVSCNQNTSSLSVAAPGNLPTLRIPSPTYGSGKHEMVMFTDFQCPACIAASKSVLPVFEEYAKKGFLHITYKQYPLTAMHKNAERDALAALCVASEGKGADTYMAYKSALYAMEDAKQGATTSDADRVGAAQSISSIDSKSLAECIQNNSYLDQVHSEMKEGDALGVEGTPTLYLDDKKLDLGLFRDTNVLQTVMNRLLEVPASENSTGTVSVSSNTPSVK